MIVQRETKFTLTVDDYANDVSYQGPMLLKVRPWLDELDKDGLRYANLEIHIDKVTTDPLMGHIRATVDVEIED